MKPIAIVGLGCRFPGAGSPEALWRVARDGICTTSDVPPDRWHASDYFDAEPGTPGKMSSTKGGFVPDVDRFDAAFFGVSPREAAQMDPQQRLLLEVSWEALEHAGIPPADLAGKVVSVTLGVQRNDYGRLMADPAAFNAYTVAGNQFSMTASRLSYFYDLRGPCVAIDAGCSSVLAALHLACAGLESGDADVAFAAGVHLTLAPHDSIAASQAWMLSGTGKCRSFDAAADGYVRSEGAGVFVLKRLDDALAAGDAIAAVIRGSAFLQEGRPGGFTSPWGPEVQRTVRRALARAGVAPESVGYVEAHGVGSPVADATEYQALARVLAVEASARTGPCYLGSIKPNIGHTETAAGAASVIKAVHVLQSGIVPPLLHFEHINPDIAEELRRLVIPLKAASMAPASPRRAVVNAFGLGGMNATVVLEEAPSPVAVPIAASAGAYPVCLSARTPAALASLAARLLAFAEEHPKVTLAEISAASVRRAQMQHRAVLVASSVTAMKEGLRALATGESPGALGVRAEVTPQPPRVFFVLGEAAHPAASRGALHARFPALDRAAPLSVACARWIAGLGVVVTGVAASEAMADGARAFGSERGVKVVTTKSLDLAQLAATHAKGSDLVLDVATGALYDTRRASALVPALGGGSASDADAWLLVPLAHLWARGAAIDMRHLEGARPRHVPIPSYPFERQRCWIDDRGPGSGVAPRFTLAPPTRASSLAASGAAGSLAAGSADDADRQTALTELLRRAIAGSLGKPEEEVPVDVPVGNMGLESLQLLSLVGEARRVLGTDVDPARLMDQPSIQEMASRLVFGTGGDLRVVDLSAEGNLDDAVDASGAPPATDPAKNVLVTGATGFVGAFLLRALLDRTNATVYALVRAVDALEAERRLAQALERYGLSTAGVADRVRPVVGDVGKPLLGLSYERFDLLGTRLDAIYHSAALVNWAYPLQTLREANVNGTEEIVRLAAHLRRKPVHHVSTIGVFPLGAPELGICYERDGLFVPASSAYLGTGYNQSKWAAEKLLYTAGSRRGVPVSIYRPGFVTGRATDGVTQLSRHDFIAAFLKGIVQLGVAPNMRVALDLMPVDYLARAIVELSLRPAAPGAPRAFNMVNPEPLPYAGAYDLLRAEGYRLGAEAYVPWRDRVLSLARTPSDHALFPFWPYYAELTPERLKGLEAHMGERLPFDDANVRAGLAGTGLSCPPVRELLPVYTRFFQKAGYFPLPG